MADIPVLGFAAFSGTGKTTLLKRLIPALKNKDLKVAVIKHAHHDFDVDWPGKDSYELRAAGAEQVLISSARRFVKIVEQIEEKPLQQCIAEVDSVNCDLILVEGYKQAQIKKLELHRPGLGFPLLCQADSNIIAVAVDNELGVEIDIPVLDLNNINQIADFIVSAREQFI